MFEGVAQLIITVRDKTTSTSGDHFKIDGVKFLDGRDKMSHRGEHTVASKWPK